VFTEVDGGGDVLRRFCSAHLPGDAKHGTHELNVGWRRTLGGCSATDESGRNCRNSALATSTHTLCWSHEGKRRKKEIESAASLEASTEALKEQHEELISQYTQHLLLTSQNLQLPFEMFIQSSLEPKYHAYELKVQQTMEDERLRIGAQAFALIDVPPLMSRPDFCRCYLEQLLLQKYHRILPQTLSRHFKDACACSTCGIAFRRRGSGYSVQCDCAFQSGGDGGGPLSI
jgi:hypothetical protein